jgi:hypothetical protein
MHTTIAHVHAINDGIPQRSTALDDPPAHNRECRSTFPVVNSPANITDPRQRWLEPRISSHAEAQDTDCGAKGPNAKPGEIKLVSWNIVELATAVKVYDLAIRSEDEFNDLRLYRDCNHGYVYAMQEIASLRALGRVFPPSEFIIFISGQTIADQRGLSPDYLREQLSGIKFLRWPFWSGAPMTTRREKPPIFAVLEPREI